MAGDDHTWQTTLTSFYCHLYDCVWHNLVPFFGPAVTDDLVRLSCQTLQESYPFLARFIWSPEGLQTESVTAAFTTEARAHVQAGCEQLLQSIFSLVQDIGGGVLAQRIQIKTEQLRLTFDPATSSPTPSGEIILAAIPPSPQEMALPLLQNVAQQALTLYCRLQHQDISTAPPKTPGQAPDAVVSVPEPSTDVVRSEAFYHGLFDLSPDGVLVTNMTGIILQANLRAAEILEFDTPEELVGCDVAQFYVHPAARATYLAQVAQRQHLEGQRGELRTKHGRTIVIMASTRLIEYEGQSCLLSVLRDVTERARLRQEMEDFAYSASHDLQAPLRTFEGYARWLLEDYGEFLDDNGRQLCREIIDDALHMKKLLDGLLEYSRIGRIHTQAVAVNVGQVIERVLHDLQLEIVDSEAQIHLPETLPTVYYPEVRLTQIFSNLLSNALKFTAGVRPEITIGCEEEERHYRFTVSDNGIGIAPEHFGRIFEIFKRLHTREEYPGTGAGLTIVKKIVESHGGRIGVESCPGVGSTFWFTIPKTEVP